MEGSVFPPSQPAVAVDSAESCKRVSYPISFYLLDAVRPARITAFEVLAVDRLKSVQQVSLNHHRLQDFGLKVGTHISCG